MVSRAEEDYIRAAFVLAERKGGEVKSKDLSAYLKVSKNTVSQMLDRLSLDGFIAFRKYSRNIKLTKKGLSVAKRLTFKHRLIERFLVDILHIDAGKVHDEAHNLEHAMSDQVVEGLNKFMRMPKVDPHGQPIAV